MSYDLKSVNSFLMPSSTSPVHIVIFNATKCRFAAIAWQIAESTGTVSKLSFFKFLHLPRSSANEVNDISAILKSKYWSLVQVNEFVSSSKIGLPICWKCLINCSQFNSEKIFWGEGNESIKRHQLTHSRLILLSSIKIGQVLMIWEKNLRNPHFKKKFYQD